MSEVVFLPDVFDPKLFPTTEDGEPQCVFAIAKGNSSVPAVLAEAFFRSAYTVVDMHNKKVAMAAVRPDRSLDDSQVVSFNGNGAPIPSATEAPNQPSAVLNQTLASPTIADWRSIESNYTAAAGFKLLKSTSSIGSNGGLANSVKAGIGVGVGVCSLLLLACAFLLWKKRQNRKGVATLRSADSSTVFGVYKPELSADPARFATHLRHEADGQALPEIWPQQCRSGELEGREIPVEMDSFERPVEIDAHGVK
ncbi:Uu.00g011990.m01.CDS01 [Anthostomella pinea]|uniref:Uu.00g011990.m01.CDS01 n=1 Tax=Anthostomella pinea TaxID=933095 RepID=A0AAI8VYS4_9PEZI|nr:Uu.00g011990.m01.CDS01 [Anthostomella pinea]